MNILTRRFQIRLEILIVAWATLCGTIAIALESATLHVAPYPIAFGAMYTVANLHLLFYASRKFLFDQNGLPFVLLIMGKMTFLLMGSVAWLEGWFEPPDQSEIVGATIGVLGFLPALVIVVLSGAHEEEV